MSGVCAALMLDGSPLSQGVLQRMRAAAAYRGPDGSRTWIAGPAGLAHLAFDSIPEDRASSQPLLSADGALTVVLDGRIDNRRELISALGLPPRVSDAGIVCEAYAAWGSRTPARLLGDFAFVIWDARRRELFCARDAMGVRPLYYFADARRFICASDVGQILAAPGVPCAINEGMLGEYLADAVTSRVETVYAGILRVRPGAMMRVRAGHVRQEPFWRADQARDVRHTRDAQYAAHFRELFVDAVRCRLRSTRRVGILLSGGIDSAAVAVTAAAVADPDMPLRAFSLSFADPEADERQYARDVANRARIPLEVTGGRDPGLRPGPEMSRDVHDWLRDIPADRWKRRIRSHGVGVVLTGHGGDTGFYGSHYVYADLLRRGRLVAALRQWRMNRRDEEFGATAADFFSAGVWPLLPRVARLALRPLARSVAGTQVIPSWIDPRYARRIDLADRLRPRSERRRGQRASRDDVRCAYDAGWMAIYRENEERESLEAGLEERHPFLDRRIVEFALGIPDYQRRRGTVTRYVVRQALSDLLPPSVRQRRGAADGSARVARAIEALGGAALFDDLVLARRGLLQQRAVSAMYRRLRRRLDGGDVAYNADAYALWIIGGTELWYRRCTSERLPATVASQAGPQRVRHDTR